MFAKGKKFTIILSVILIIFSFYPNLKAEEVDSYDVVIKGGTIYNPSTEHELENYNIGINGSKIERITQEALRGITEINADGLVISPGFIDLVSYDPNHVGIEFKVFDGVTSNLAMHGGTEDAASWYASWESSGVITNFGASSFITRLRWPIIGAGIDNEMTDQADIDRLVEETRKNIENGALGISFSFEYVPGVKHEVKPLLELAAEYDVPTFYHLRYSDEEKGLKGVQEVIDYGKETGASIHIMHINSTGGTFVMDQALEMVREAREDGLDITTDFYPYDFWATYINSARFRPGWQERFKITYEDLQIGATDIRITEDTFDYYREQYLLVAAHGSMPEDELRMLLADPHTMVGSDTIIEASHNNHPRGAGTYSRLFGKYVREEQVLTMMDAIKKSSYYPAKRMESAAPSMHYKGRIEVGADADITIFDPNTIIDKSTVEAPGTHSVGVEYVLVNGVLVKDTDGLVDVEKPGQPIMSYFVDERAQNEMSSFEVSIDEEMINLENVYQINGTTYLPLDNVFNHLDLPIETFNDGTIIINESLNLELGNRYATMGEEEIKLDDELILYEERIYMPLNSANQLLNTNYDVVINESDMELTSITSNDGSGDISDSDATDKEVDQSEGTIEQSNDPNFIMMIGLSVIAVITIVIIYIRLKNRK